MDFLIFILFVGLSLFFFALLYLFFSPPLPPALQFFAFLPCFNLPQPQRYQLRKQGHLLAFIAKDKLSGPRSIPVRYESRRLPQHEPGYSLTALGGEIKNKTPINKTEVGLSLRRISRTGGS